MKSKHIVQKFVEQIASGLNPDSSAVIKVSNDPSLELPDAKTTVAGFDWLDQIQSDCSFELIVSDLPLGMGRKKINVGGETINVRSNWVELWKALQLLAPNGLCVAIIEPPAFGIAEGPMFQKALAKEGFYLTGVFNCPPNLFSTTNVQPVIITMGRAERSKLFVGELKEESQAQIIAQNFIDNNYGNSLQEGISLSDYEFDGFDRLKARLQIERLETQYKEYSSYTLGDIAVEMNSARSGSSLEHKNNAIYVPVIGTSEATDDLSAVAIKHHNIIQVVLSDVVKSQYVAAFFRSDLGLLVLRSLAKGVFIPRINKSELAKAQISVPSLSEQEKIIHTHTQLQALKISISTFQRELALNPRSASVIGDQVDSMLETVGALTETDRVMSLVREGESAKIEFKESFSLDVRKGTKEKYIEDSAMKTIVAFLNTQGGVLLIGVADDGGIPGICVEAKKFYKNNDAFLLHFKNQLKHRIGEQYYPYINQRLVNIDDTYVLVVECQRAKSPCYLDGKEFYVRTNPATDKLEGPKLVEYVQNHFNEGRSL